MTCIANRLWSRPRFVNHGQRQPLVRQRTRLLVRALEDRLAPALFTVTNTLDGTVTMAGDLPGSLRQAIFDANALAGTDTIKFGVVGTITLTNGELSISQALDINGPGAADLSISGNNASRIFNANNAAKPAVTLTGLTLTAGKAPAQGGAILANGNVTVQNCLITGNSATFGGGIGAFTGGVLTIADSVISNNKVTGSSGGFFAGTAVITRTTISGNAALNAAGGYVLGSLSMVQSTVSGNTASGAGGGMEIESSNAGDVFLIQNCTFSENTSATGGGGIALGQFGSFAGTLRVQNTTFTNNKATGGVGGGGIARFAGAGLITLDSTIVSGNTDTSGKARPDLFTTGTVNANFSAVGSKAGVTSFNGDATTTALLGAALNLGGLADNGGPTLTHQPGVGSPLLSKGSNPAALATDQRGVGFPRSINTFTDIGAINGVAPTSFVVRNTNDAGVDSLRQAVIDSNGVVGTQPITFDPAVFTTPLTITLTTSEIAITDDTTITGPAAQCTVSGNNASRIFNANNAADPSVTLIGLRLTAGKAPSQGGAVLSSGDLTLQGCVITGNTGTFGGGVGVLSPGLLTVSDSVISNNVATSNSGGFFAYSAIIQRTTISGNSAKVGAGGYVGGNLTMAQCTVSGNFASSSTGGIELDSYGAGTVALIQNCTFSGNTAATGGGGLGLGSFGSFNGMLKIQNSTITNNTANGASGGGGIARLGGTGAITLDSTIVSGNLAPASANKDFFTTGTVTANFSAIGIKTGITTFVPDAQTTALLGAALNLGGLANNGGPTLTHLPAANSPVINQGSNVAGLTTDQRGAPAARSSNGGVDIGAVERQVYIVINTNDAGAGSLRQAVLDASALASSADDIIFDTAGVFATPQTIILTSGEMLVNDSVNINGPAARVTVDGNATGRIFNVNAASLTLNGMNLINGKAASGGAILLTNSSLSLTDCILSGHVSTAQGGAISVGGAMAGNMLSIDFSTLSGNKSTNSGGAILITQAINVNIRNSTISGNTSNLNGGGIRAYSGFTGTLTVLNSTITQNVLVGTGAGRGISLGAGTCNITSTIVAQNSGGPATTADLNGKFNVDFSLIGTTDGATIVGANNITGTNAAPQDAKLAALANNGGPTLTHIPAADSPVINKGSNPGAFTTDQRGVGFPRVLNTLADIGAIEFSPANFVVRNTNDAGVDSLRQAVLDSNALVGTQGVTFDPVVFAGPTGITLMTGQIPVTESVNITGPTATCTVSGNGASRIFNSTFASGLLSISNLSFAKATAAGTGGAINSSGGADLTLTNCSIAGNTSSAGGAGVCVIGGILTATDCVFNLNTAGNAGGGIDVFGLGAGAVLTRCVITGNTGQFGGGAYVGGSFTMDSCTISGNTDTGTVGGGGLQLAQSVGATIRNSTISGNTSNTSGGGIDLAVNFTATLTVQNSTITNNTSKGGNGGGGIARSVGSTGTINVESTIVSGNVDSSGNARPDLYTTGTVNANFSAVGSKAGVTTFNGDATTNGLLGAALSLGALGDNGGPTQTHLPAANSPVINMGSNPAGLTNDQRGAPAARSSNGGVDIGAVERQSFLVTNINDSGAGSLRQAVLDANALTPSDDSIRFDTAGVFATPQIIPLTSGELLVTDSVAILGPTARVTVSGNNASRVFNMNGTGILTIALTNLTISNANALGMIGGGILSADENLTITNCSIINNVAGVGGGIRLENNGAVLTLINSIVSGNSAALGNGGGINANGASTISITRSTVANNIATANAGGMEVFSGGSLTITDSTFSGNKATNGVSNGGGMELRGAFGTLSILNSTFSGNTAANFGGGVALTGVTSNLTVQNSTFTLNAATKGGGIGRTAGTAVINLESTIVSGDTASNTGPDLYTTGTVNAKTSLIGTIAGITTFTPDAVTLLILGKPALLSPLQDNTGPTLTHALLAGSPAINNGSNPAGLAADQRGRPRPVGNMEIGSVEVEPPAKVASVMINDGSAQRSLVTSVKVTFDSPVAFAGAPEAAFTLVRPSDSKSVNLAAAIDNSGPGTLVTLSFVGGEVDGKSLRDGRYTLTALASQFNGDGLDGDGNGIGGDNYELLSTGTTGIFRLFGDANGDAAVTTFDFAVFRSFFGLSGPSMFDFNGDNLTNAADFGQFRARFGLMI